MLTAKYRSTIDLLRTLAGSQLLLRCARLSVQSFAEADQMKCWTRTESCQFASLWLVSAPECCGQECLVSSKWPHVQLNLPDDSIQREEESGSSFVY